MSRQRLAEIKDRMGGIQTIMTMTQTMATVAVAKLSRTRVRAEGMRVYADRIKKMLLTQQMFAAERGEALDEYSPLLQPHPQVNKLTLLHLSSDMRMCGNYNLMANRKARDFLEAKGEGQVELAVVAKGKQGNRYLENLGYEIVRYEQWGRTGVGKEEAADLLAFLVERYNSGEADEVYCCFTHFLSPVQRYARLVRLLPVEVEAVEAPPMDESVEWLYQPDFGTLIRGLVPLYLNAQLYDFLLESFASEQGARMIAMEEATERARRSLHDCRIRYNRVRREAITADLIGMLCAAEAGAGEEEDKLWLLEGGNRTPWQGGR